MIIELSEEVGSMAAGPNLTRLFSIDHCEDMSSEKNIYFQAVVI